MKVRGITFSDENMTRSAMLCRESMLRNGVDECSIWSPQDIQPEFKQFNANIFDGKRGAGCYWVFKPYIIYSRMLRTEEGDILIYSDAGVEFITHVSEIITCMDEDFFFFTNTHPQFHWTKREVMEQMHMPGRLDIGQAQASVIFMKVNKATKDFIKRWLLWCQMPDLINDVMQGDQKREFQDHRHDQSILTNLIVAHGYKMHWWPTAYAEHIRVPGDTYPVLFNHHRKRNHEWI